MKKLFSIVVLSAVVLGATASNAAIFIRRPIIYPPIVPIYPTPIVPIYPAPIVPIYPTPIVPVYPTPIYPVYPYTR